MRGDSTAHSTVLVCDCGARFAATAPERAYSLMLSHQQAAGCDTRATTAALRMRERRRG